MGREAARCELRDRGPRPRLHEGGADEGRARRGRLVPRVDAQARRGAQPRRLVRPSRRRDDRAEPPRPAGEAPGSERGEGGREGAHEGQPQGVREADARRRRRAAHRLGPAADRSAADLAAEAGIPFERLEGVIHQLFREYRQTLQHDRRHLLEEFRMVDLARKVVGVGSVGTRCWIVLLLGRDGDDPLFLQIKEAQASVLEPYLGKSAVREPRPARRRRPAADAGDERHLPRLGAHEGDARRRRARLLRPPALGLEDVGRPRHDPARRPRALRRRSAASSSHGRMPARATGSRSPPTSARATPSTGRSPSSRSPTPTRTSATTPRCGRPPTRAASRYRKGSRRACALGA